MKYKILIGIIIIIGIIFGVIFYGGDKYYFDDIDLVKKVGDVNWEGYDFRIAKKGNVEFVENGFDVWGTSNSDDGLVTSKLLNVNLNKKVKVKVVADMTGNYVSGDWSEFAIYLAEKTDSFNDNKAGIALLGSRDNVDGSGAPNAGKNLRDNFNFEWFSIENTGNTIIFSDSWGRTHEEQIYEKRIDDVAKPSIQPILQNLNSDKEWNIRINSHVKGNGWTKLRIKEIIIEENG